MSLPAAERFDDAVRSALRARGGGGIGTLGERTLHAALKFYYEPDGARHEARVGRYVADIFADGRITEIQTRGFYKLRRKLEAFLTEYDVTVVYPVAQTKYLLWIDPATGETTKRRRSPKTGRPADALYELNAIRPLLGHPRLRVRVPLLEIEEYRLLDGWSRDGKRGSTRSERVPLALVDEAAFETAGDYRAMVPAGLPEPFTSRDFARAFRYSPRAAGTALLVLSAVGAVERTGKRGNSYLYRAAGTP